MWSALMWFSSLEGVSNISKNNLITSCLGGIFLAVQKKVKNLRFTTTEPLEHTFGTTRSWKREFTINEFLSYSDKVDIILKNVIEHGICTSSSSKGYMQGFKGFAEVVCKIKDKLIKKKKLITEDSWAVDVDYEGLPIIEQIEGKIIGAIGRINPAVFNIMNVFGMKHLSQYCTNLNSISDLCGIYRSSSKGITNLNNKGLLKAKSPPVNTEEIIMRLSNLALEFNSGNGSKTETTEDVIDCKEIVSNKISEERETWIHFDCQIFYNFLTQDVSNDNVGKLLDHMKNSINNSMETKRVDGSTTELQKVQSLKGRWFKVKFEDVENIEASKYITRNDLFRMNGKLYRVLSVFKKSYNKWRLERSGTRSEKLKIHLQLLDKFLDSYIVDKSQKYICINSAELGIYIGHAFPVNN